MVSVILPLLLMHSKIRLQATACSQLVARLPGERLTRHTSTSIHLVIIPEPAFSLGFLRILLAQQIPPFDQWLVQGVILYRLEGVDAGDELSTDFVVADFPHTLLDEASTSEAMGGVLAPQVRSIRV